MALRTVGVRLVAETSVFRAEMAKASTATKSFTKEMGQAAQTGRLDAVADGAAQMGLGLAGAFAVAVGAAAKFDKQMSEVAAVSNATAEEMEQLRAAALQAGKDTAFSATEAAKAQAELAKAGLNTAQILGGALDGALALAAAGGLDLAEAADISAKAMNMFGLKGKDVTHIADVLAATANKSATDVHEMGEALKMGGLAANAAGMSLEETSGTLAAFADRALVGSDAGTSLKTMLMMLQAPTNKASNLMKDLGLSAYDASGQFVGTVNLAGQLQRALGPLSQEQRNAALAIIFGADAMRAANVLYTVGETKLRDYVSAVDDQGAAADVAAKKMDNLAGDIEKLRGSLETMAIEAGSGANGGLRVLVQTVGSLVDEFASLPPGIGSTITVMAGLGGAALLLGAGWVKSRRATADFRAELASVGPAGAAAANGLERTTKWATRAAAGFAALQVTGAIVAKSVGGLNPQVDAMAQGLADWGAGMTLTGEAARVLGDDMDDLNVGLKFLADTDNSRRKFARWGQDLLETTVPGLDSANTSLARTRERVAAIDQSFAQLVQNGNADAAKEAFDRLAASQAENGVTVEELREKFPQYSAALETASGSAASAVAPTDAAGRAIGGVGQAAGDAEKKVEELTKAFDQLFGVQMDLDEALIGSQEAIGDLTKAFRDNGSATDINTEKGRTNRRAVLDRIQSIKDERQARIDNGATMDQANGKYVKDIDGLRKSMRQAGFTKKQIDELTTAYRKIPEKVNTQVAVAGNAAAENKLRNLSSYQLALQKGIPVAQARKQHFADHQASKYAEGGKVRGSSPHKRADNIPALLTAEEHIWTVDEVRGAGGHAEVERMRRLAAAGQLPRYAGGGRVTWPFPVNVAGTRVPSRREVEKVVVVAPPIGGATAPWMVSLIKDRFPHVDIISTFRRGSRTLSGNLSYHARNRAVDTEPNEALARYMYGNHKGRLREAITPYPEWNVHNGRDHRYTGAVWRQHAFGYGNAHNHFAMANGGDINEPVFGVGRSGRTYSFGERGSERVMPNPQYLASKSGPAVVHNHVHLNNNGAIGSRMELERWFDAYLDGARRRGKVR